MKPFSFFFFFLIFVTAIAEFILSAFWVPFYFRFGIPLFRCNYRLTEIPADWSQYISVLEAQLPPSWGKAGVVFRAVGPQELAYRHSLKRNSRNAVHGRLYFDSFSQELIITGYMDWSLFLMPLFVVSIAILEGMALFFGIFALFALLFYISRQRTNYKRIATIVQKQFPTTSSPEQSPPLLMDGPYADPFAAASSKPPGLTPLEMMLVVVLLIMLFVTGAVFALYLLGR